MKIRTYLRTGDCPEGRLVGEETVNIRRRIRVRVMDERALEAYNAKRAAEADAFERLADAAIENA